jgi:hypothetical protein
LKALLLLHFEDVYFLQWIKIVQKWVSNIKNLSSYLCVRITSPLPSPLRVEGELEDKVEDKVFD